MEEERAQNGCSDEKALREKVRLCPHCNKPIKITISTEILNIEDASDVEGNLTWKAGLNPEQIKTVEDAMASGLFAVFERTVGQVISIQTPRSMEKFFVTFMQTVVLKTVPRKILDHFIKMFNKARIEFWCAQGICMIVADNCVRAVMPQEIIVGKNVGVLGKQKKRISLPVDVGNFDQGAMDQIYYLESGQWMLFPVLRQGSRQVRSSIFQE